MAPKRWQDRLLHFITYFCGQEPAQELEFSCQGDRMPLEIGSTNVFASEPTVPNSQARYPQLPRQLNAPKPDTKPSAAMESDGDCLPKILSHGNTQNPNSQCPRLAQCPASMRASACTIGTRAPSSMYHSFGPLHVNLQTLVLCTNQQVPFCFPILQDYTKTTRSSLSANPGQVLTPRSTEFTFVNLMGQ
jgi:hypothetical protein